MAGSSDTGDKMAKSKALVAAAELERRDFEITRRLDHLEQEQQALEDIRDSLLEEVELLKRRLEMAKKESARIAGQMDAKTQRTMEMMDRVEGLKREIAVLTRRCEENEKREQELSEKTAAAEASLLAAKSQIMNIEGALETGRETLARMDRKLSLNRLKR